MCYFLPNTVTLHIASSHQRFLDSSWSLNGVWPIQIKSNATLNRKHAVLRYKNANMFIVQNNHIVFYFHSMHVSDASCIKSLTVQLKVKVLKINSKIKCLGISVVCCCIMIVVWQLILKQIGRYIEMILVAESIKNSTDIRYIHLVSDEFSWPKITNNVKLIKHILMRIALYFRYSFLSDVPK